MGTAWMTSMPHSWPSWTAAAEAVAAAEVVAAGHVPIRLMRLGHALNQRGVSVAAIARHQAHDHQCHLVVVGRAHLCLREAQRHLPHGLVSGAAPLEGRRHSVHNLATLALRSRPPHLHTSWVAANLHRPLRLALVGRMGLLRHPRTSYPHSRRLRRLHRPRRLRLGTTGRRRVWMRLHHHLRAKAGHRPLPLHRMGLLCPRHLPRLRRRSRPRRRRLQDSLGTAVFAILAAGLMHLAAGLMARHRAS